MEFLRPFAGQIDCRIRPDYSAKVADWFGNKTDKDYGKNKPTATEGVHDAMGKVIGINAGIVGAAGVAKAVPVAAATIARHPGKTIAGTDFISGFFDPGPPPQTLGGVAGSGTRKGLEELEEKWRKRR
jgi:hypothetical protein